MYIPKGVGAKTRISKEGCYRCLSNSNSEWFTEIYNTGYGKYVCECQINRFCPIDGSELEEDYESMGCPSCGFTKWKKHAWVFQD